MRAAAVVVPPEVEVADRPKRRKFTAEYKRRILEETDKASPGEIGAILRREGLYSSHLVDWRRARRVAELEALAPKKRGPAPKAADERDRKIAELERENAKLKKRAVRAEALVELQKKVSDLLGLQLPEGDESEKDS